MIRTVLALPVLVAADILSHIGYRIAGAVHPHNRRSS